MVAIAKLIFQDIRWNEIENIWNGKKQRKSILLIENNNDGGTSSFGG